MTVVPETGRARPRARFHALDLLRVAAALAVVLFHYGFRGAAADGLSPARFETLGRVARYGYLGVDLFFIVSGYAIALSATGRTAGAFALARARRLYPALWVCCLATAAGAWASGRPEFAVTWPQLIGNLSLIRVAVGPVSSGLVDGAYWSLQVELRFYAAVAALLLWTRGEPTRTARALTGLTAAWMLGAAADYAGLVPGRHGGLWLPYAPLFAAGVAYAALARGSATRLDRVTLLAAVPLSVAFGVRDAAANAAHYHAAFSPLVVAAVLLAGHAGFALATARGWDLPASPIWPALGAVAYPLYLLHQHLGYEVFWATARRADPRPVLAAVVAAMVAAAFAIARWVEPRVLARVDAAIAAARALGNTRRAPARTTPRPVLTPATAHPAATP